MSPEPSLEQIVAALGPAVPPAGRQLVRRAYALARRLHAGQMRRDGSRVFDHVRRVTSNVVDAGGVDPELIAAALLHDVLEKAGATTAHLQEAFGARVACLVDAVTNRAGDDAAASVARAQAAGTDALLLRLCDRLDGVRGSWRRPPDECKAFLESTRVAHLVAAEKHHPALAAKLREAIVAAERADR